MEKIFFVVNDNLDEVNDALANGGKVKMIQIVSEAVSSYAYAGSDTWQSTEGCNVGDIIAYIVVTMP